MGLSRPGRIDNITSICKSNEARANPNSDEFETYRCIICTRPWVRASSPAVDSTNEHGVKSVTFTVTPVSGNVGLYVRSCPSSSVSETQCNDNIPIGTRIHCSTVTQSTPACYLWKSDGSWYDSESVEIQESDPNWMLQGRYKILVRGVQASNYTITASTDRSVVTLEEGEAYRGYVDKHSYEYYQFVSLAGHASGNPYVKRVQHSQSPRSHALLLCSSQRAFEQRADVPNTDITFAITSFGGDPDLFVACQLEMTHDDNGWPSRLCVV